MPHPYPGARRKRRTAAVLTAGLAVLSIALLAYAARGAAAEAPGGRDARAGRLVTLELASAPFPHKDRADGYSADGEDYSFARHYDDSSSTVYVSADCAALSRVDIVLFFHGWYDSREEAEDEFGLIEQFERSGARGILVIPETAKDAPDSFGGKFEDTGGFGRYIRDLLAALREKGLVSGARPGAIVLAGHSGAYRVISKIVSQRGLSSSIREVYLFDGLYGGLDEFGAWIRERRGRFVCVCSDGGEPEENAKDLVRSLEGEGIEAAWAKDDPAEDGRALAFRVAVLTSGSDHYGVVCDKGEFRRLLASSKSLSRR